MLLLAVGSCQLARERLRLSQVEVYSPPLLAFVALGPVLDLELLAPHSDLLGVFLCNQYSTVIFLCLIAFDRMALSLAMLDFKVLLVISFPFYSESGLVEL